MNKRALIVIGLLVVALLAQGFWIWQLETSTGSAGITLRATNMGVELAADDGRVIVHPSGKAHVVVAEGELEQAFDVAPGIYDVEIIFSRASDSQSHWLRDVRLDPGQQLTQEVEFNSGELNVEAVTNDNTTPVQIYVFKQGEHDQVVTSMPAGTAVLLAPGVYDLRVVLTEDSAEKDIHWQKDVPVQPGLQTRVRVPFQRGELMVHARNGEQVLPAGTVELAVYRAGDRHRELLEAGLAQTPLGLAVGRYDVAATFVASHDRPVRWLHDVAVVAGQTLDRHIEFDSATLAISARVVDGDEFAPYQAYAYFYIAGNHKAPIAYTTVPDPAVLASGHYDVRVHFFRSHDQPDIWLRNLFVPGGQRTERTVQFASGKVLIRAYDAAGDELVGDSVFVHIHAAGERMRALSVARSGELLTLTAGRYDLRIVDSRDPTQSTWLEQVEVRSGRLTKHAITFSNPAR